MSPNRVLSGMRATGALHLGHYHGVLKNWVALQNQSSCLFFVADWHALTTHYDNVGGIEAHTLDMVVDWLASGIDPEKAVLFVQSHVLEHAELHLLLSMVTPLGWLERVPTYKDQQEKLSEKDLSTYGFLGYPVLQTADILIYRATQVPVGEDQVPHIELSREIARRFNYLFGKKSKNSEDEEVHQVILPEPKALLTESAKMPGLDGQKMSKSYQNTITLRDEDKTVDAKIRKMPTDPARVRRTDAGNPEKCPVWALHQVYTGKDKQQELAQGCRSAGIGCIDCKQPLIDAICAELQPMRERAAPYLADKNLVRKILADGAQRARLLAQDTMRDVRQAMGLINMY